MSYIIVLSTILVSTSLSYALPIVDPGLFVISGVKTCGGGEGYCLLGSDCSLDQDFIDDSTGHCGGLRKAFTPATHFVCCSDSKKQNEIDDTSKPVASKYPAVIEEDFSTTERVETTTFEIEKDYLLLEPDSIKGVNEKENKCEECNSTIKFSMDGNQLCLGSYVRDDWVVTSASCAMKIFRIGMVNVIGSFVDDSSFESSVKTIIVHENYRPSASNIPLPETNNLGLIQLNDTQTDRCAPCLPKSGQIFAGHECQTPLNYTSPDSKSFCESEAETMQGEAKEEFLTIACDTSMQSNYMVAEADKGKPLICDGYVTGIETSAGVGMTVFTQLSLYSDWMASNMEPKANQKFRTV